MSIAIQGIPRAWSLKQVRSHFMQDIPCQFKPLYFNFESGKFKKTAYIQLLSDQHKPGTIVQQINSNKKNKVLHLRATVPKYVSKALSGGSIKGPKPRVNRAKGKPGTAVTEPDQVTLRDLSYNLDRLFNTDEIETFKVRDLPNHPQTNKRQIALDFRSSYDAMAAQEKLDGYTYELDNGREYTLHAKINKSEEYMCSDSPEDGGSRWYGDDWTALAMIPNVSDSEIYKAHAKLDAQLELLKKQKVVLEKEKELLNERQKLKRKYGSMVSALYEAPSLPPARQYYAEHTYTEAEVSPPKGSSRSTSQDRFSSSKRPRSRSRETRLRRSRSKDSGYVLPQIEWYDERTKTRELSSRSRDRSRSRAYSKDRSRARAYSNGRSRSRAYSKCRSRSRAHSKDRSRSRAHSKDRSRSCAHSNDRSRSRAHSRDRSRSLAHSKDRSRTRAYSRDRSRSRVYSRDRRSSSQELRDHGYPASRRRETRSRSNEILGISEVYRRSPSKKRVVRARSRSQDRMLHSRDSRSRERKSHSRERKYSRGSRPQDSIPYRRSRSRDRAHRNDDRGSRSDWDHRGRRLRSPDRRTNQLAVKPRGSTSERSVDSSTSDTPTDTKHKTYAKNKQVRIKVEKDVKNTLKAADTKVNKTDNKKKNKDKESKKADKYNSKLRKVQKTASKVQALSKDVMILVAMLVDEIMDRDRIRISAANKVVLIKIIEALVQERLEPIARVKKNDDNEVLKKYKMQYPMEDDLKMIKQMLNEIPKLEKREPAATVTVSSEIDKTAKNNVVEILDEGSEPTEKQCPTNNVSVDLTHIESTDNAPKIKTEPREEPILIIDIDSAEKPVPRNPQFVVVIKSIVKNMNKVIRTNKLGGEIKFGELKHVLRHILKNMLKGQAYVPREEIIRRFRDIYPMENDEQFVRNTIEDIRDGKYPGLAAKVVDAPENDSPDDVLIIEKKYDVVTLTDSDDDDDKKPNIEVSLNSDPIHDCHDSDQANPSQPKPNSSPSQAMPGPSNDHVKLGAVNPGQEGSSNSVQDQPRSTITAPSNKDRFQPSQGMTVPPNDNLNIDRTDTNPIVESANPGQANSYCEKGVASRLHMPDLGSPCQVKIGLANPIQGHTSLVNHRHIDTDLPKPSQAHGLCCTYPSQDISAPANSSQVQTGLGNPGQAGTGVPNSNQAKTGPANHSQAVPSPAVACQAKNGSNNPGQAKTGPGNPGQAKKGSNNLGQSNTGASLNANQKKKGPGKPSQAKTGPTNSGQAKTGPANSGQAKISPDHTGQAKTWPLNASQATKGPNNPGQAKKNVKISQAMSDPAKPSQPETGPISGKAKVAPSNTMSMKENEKRASLDNTIQNLESKEMQETPERNKTIQSNEDSKDKDNRTNNEENDNNLKVTAITIFTSLNDLIAKTTAKESETISAGEIKEEIEIKEEAELDDSSLNLDNGPRVTAITIMTTDAELFSLGNEERKEVNDIKNETDVYYDAEDNFVKDIESAFDDVNFENIQSESIVQNSVDSEQFCSVNNSGQLDKTQSLPQDKRTVPEDEETIESIVKYVASLY